MTNVSAGETLNAKTIWGKVVLYLKEKKHIALQIACGDITDIKFEDGDFVITTTEKDLEQILLKNMDRLKEAFAWQQLDCKIVVRKKQKLAEMQEEDIQKLKDMGFENLIIIKGDKQNGKF